MIQIRTYILAVFLLAAGILHPQSFSYPVVFVSRNHLQGGNILYPQAGLLPGMGPHSRFKTPGGRLLIREAGGNIISLVDSTKIFGGICLIDVQQPCVNWDGNRILFAGIENRDSSWRIFEIRKDGTGFRKLTFTDRNINLSQFGTASNKFLKYDDTDPVYLPDGKIIFASTRYPTLSQYGSVLAANLFIMDSAGNNMFRITSERNGAEKPSIDPNTGRIVYSRWWLNADMPSHLTATGLTRDTGLALSKDNGNLWQVNEINPDGDMLKLYAGNPESRKSLFAYRPRIDNSGKMFAGFIPHMPMVMTGGSPGIRYFSKGLSDYRHIAGVDTSTQLYSQNPPSYGTYIPPYAADALPLNDGRVLFSYANTVEQQDYGIYVSNINGTGLMQVVDFPVTLELNAELLIEKQKPPVVEYLNDYDTNKLPPVNNLYQGGLFRFDCMNIYSNAPVDAPIGDAPGITRNAQMRFFINYQRQNPEGLDYPVLFREVRVDHDGKIAQGDIPANIPMFEQITDSSGKVLVNRKNNIAHVTGFNFGSKGSGTKCVGCHAGHTQIKVPVNITEAQFTNLSTSANVTQSSYYGSYKGENAVDRKARNTNLNVNWISNGGTGEYIDLNWELPLDVRELKLYNVFPNPDNNTNITVNDCEVYIYYGGKLVRHIPSTGALDTGGKSVPVTPFVTADRIRIVIKSYSGTINGMNRSALAEAEIIARVSDYESTGTGTIGSTVNDFRLYENYPNPFNSSTVIRYSLPERGMTRLNIYDISGRLITRLIDGITEPGENSVMFNAGNLASGIYFAELTSGTNKSVRKIVLMK
jgi:hypothetical protein